MRVVQSRAFLVSVCILVALAALAPPAMAQEPWISYSAKFVCGREAPPLFPAVDSLALGRYKTMVSIHNPHYLTIADLMEPVPVVFFKKVVLTRRQGEEPLPPSCKVEEFLLADRALFMDCKEIKRILALSGLPSTGQIEGFVVIEVPPQPVDQGPVVPLDVVAVYTGRPSRADVATLDVERIRGRPIIGTPTVDCLIRRKK